MLAAVVGDEMALRNDIALVDNVNTAEVVSVFMHSIRQANAGASTLQVVQALARVC
jgi:hypothetical protein